MALRHLLLLAALGSLSAAAQPVPDAGTSALEGADIGDLSLDALLNAPIAVATRSVRQSRATPGVVSVLNREEILASGASNLGEVLQLLPGFQMQMDVYSVIGAGFRGLWGQEGKVLLLIDGQEQNELLYGSNVFGHHYLVHDIERVEVIRGPGSAVYGGFAELAVINVITRGARELKGVSVAGRYGQMSSTWGDRSVGVGAGWVFESLGDLEASVTAHLGQGTLGEGTYTSQSGVSYGLNDQRNAQSDPVQVNAALAFKGLKARFIYDDYHLGSQDGYGEPTGMPERQRFRTIGAELSYALKLGDRVTLRPRVSYKNQLPWQITDPASTLFYDKTATRILGGLALELEPVDNLNVLVGGEVNDDTAWLNSTELIGAQTTFRGDRSVSYLNGAGFAQVLWDNPIVNVALGARAEYHSLVGFNFAPRIGLTRQLDRFNVKLLYSGSFRSPSFENINASVDGTIKPERTNTAEVEAGFQFSDLVYGALNVFYIDVRNPIVYAYVEATNSDSYVNYPQVGSAGYELEAMVRGRAGFLKLTYSTYFPTQNSVPYYDVAGTAVGQQYLGFAVHKVTALGKWRIWKGLAVGGSGVLLSERPAYTSVDADGNPVLSTVPAQLLLTVWAGYEGLGLKGLDLQLGVGNVLGTHAVYVQPYNQGHAPYPDKGREYFVRLSYAFQPG